MQCGDSVIQSLIFGYELDRISSINGSIIGLLAVDFTPASMPDNQMYSILKINLPFIRIRTLYMSVYHEYYDLE
jgi:hypothetical protein